MWFSNFLRSVKNRGYRDKLYKIVSENKDADFILWNGTRAQIKRKKFENYIDKLNIL